MSAHTACAIPGADMSISEYDSWVARGSTTSSVFNAIAEVDRQVALFRADR
jgi:hypothetical protein